MKLIKRLILVAVLLVILVAVALFYYIDSIAKSGIEKGATYALGVDTKLDNVSIGLFSGKFGMDKLHVTNPSGFSSPHFFALGKAELAVSLGSLMGDKVHVPRIAFKDIDLHLDKANGKANYDVIMENLKKLESKSDDTVKDESGTGKRFVIDVIEIENVAVHVNLLPELGQLTKLDISIPSLTLKNIGSDSDKGALMADVTDVVIKAIMKAVIAKGGLPADMLGDLQGRLAQLQNIDKVGIQMADKVINDVTGKVTGEIEKVTKDLGKDLLKDAGKDMAKDLTKDLTKDLGKGVGDLFGKDKKDKKDKK
jgi:uncharacterized protein involved in outer membrane biogenesis